ncbi:hypothetical protein RhiirC2_800487 [Rhizophagus irregularis]|uniref:Uncharacterized protein n=1 Tax=Rhizophagus irregularis TaxID=588596 RepID=A0A2N1M3M0_9GLOM|nr:hypothetical protein RhiirC2_800487 [Rhizophagus irregularis]
MGNTIKLSVKRQYKYQILRVKIVLNSFTLPQFNKFWTTDLGGIPVRWFSASWTFCERKQQEKFQAVIHDILEEMTIATLWNDRFRYMGFYRLLYHRLAFDHPLILQK